MPTSCAIALRNSTAWRGHSEDPIGHIVSFVFCSSFFSPNFESALRGADPRRGNYGFLVETYQFVSRERILLAY